MSNYDRFKPTSISSVKERKQQVSNITNEYENDSSNGKVKRMNIKKDGVYKIRMYPAHPIEGALSTEPKVVYFVPSMRRKKDQNGNFIKDKNDQFVLEESIKPVFDARIHGESKYDLVDTYISLAKSKAKQLYSDNQEEEKKYLAPIIGNKFQGGQYMGINPNRTTLFYGDLIKGEGENETKEFYEFEVGKAIEKGLQKTAAIENNNEPLGTDGCFTDPLEGRPMKIVVDSAGSKAAKDPSLYYTVSIVTEQVKENIGGRIVTVLKQYPISEEELDWFDKEVEPLINYRKIFSRRDLDIQLKGLEMFENQFKFGIFDMDEFKQVYNYLDAKFPVKEEDENSDTGEQESNSSKKEEDQYDLMDKNELKAHIKENNLGIVVLPRHTEEDVREMIREIENSDSNSSSQEENEVKSDDQDADLEKSENSGAIDFKSKIKGIKEKLASQQ